MDRLTIRKIKETVSSRALWLLAGLVLVLFIGVLFVLVYKSSLALSTQSIVELLFSSEWNPERNSFGFLPAIAGTFYVTLISLIIAIPTSIFSAIYIAEYSRGSLRAYLQSFIDVLAGIPSVVFGLCALLVLVPFVSDYLGPFLGVETTGMCVFTAGLVLAVMVFPIIISLSVESLRSLPVELREVPLSLGATKWETIKKVLLKAAGPGIISAILLGFGRAFGETMAVAMVIGGKNQIPLSIFSAGQTLPSLIVSSFGEMMSVPLEQSTLIFVALVLFFVVTVFNLLSRIVKARLKKRWKIK
ncbi:MAG: phosphate ABC transporter permease subunit PstC [Candidatus Bipolaricaulia bacterium]